jgi:hypothetical protein
MSDDGTDCVCNDNRSSSASILIELDLSSDHASVRWFIEKGVSPVQRPRVRVSRDLADSVAGQQGSSSREDRESGAAELHCLMLLRGTVSVPD